MRAIAARLATALVGMPVVLTLFWVAGNYQLDWLVGLVVSVAGVMAGWEYIQIVSRLGIPQPKEFLMMAIPVFLMLSVLWEDYALVAGWGVVYFTVVYSFFRKGPREGFFAALAGIFGFLYIPVLLSILYFLHRADFAYVLHFFLIVWGYDAGAFLVGSAIGKHQLLPRVSLAKTWEGVVGGVVIAMIGAALLPVFVSDFLRWLPHVVVLGVWVGTFAQLGDLFESLFKRAAGVKHTGWLLPGHGGMLDRLDGVLGALPVYFFYMRYVLELI
ncbi:MAG: phosphatidate cytidylyltransferase [Candidatus Bipolaricaulota bacterium]